jgi:hypothetical protein
VCHHVARVTQCAFMLSAGCGDERPQEVNRGIVLVIFAGTHIRQLRQQGLRGAGVTAVRQ